MIDQPSARCWRCFLSEAKIVFVEKKCQNHLFFSFLSCFLSAKSFKKCAEMLCGKRGQFCGDVCRQSLSGN